MQESMEFAEAGILNPLITDYLQRRNELASLVSAFPDLQGLEKLRDQRKKNFAGDRQLLANVLREQYRGYANLEQTIAQLEKLEKANCFTVTTGHQLSFGTGPLYFIYKIIHTIKLAEELERRWAESNIVPVFWMATEDHDFEEISSLNLFGKNYSWKTDGGGAVGRLNPNLTAEAIAEIKAALGESEQANIIIEWLSSGYSKANLAEATRQLVHELFGHKGLIIVDGDDKRLKQLFVPILKEEIEKYAVSDKVGQTLDLLKDLHYHAQANPREINVFYLAENSRERIVAVETGYATADDKHRFSKEEILHELENYPERFSPNVLMRPMFQEFILPNLCYLGGGGEIAYWLQLKSSFDHFKLDFPILLVRNSVVLIDGRSREKMNKLNIKPSDLFGDVEAFISEWVGERAEIDLSEQRKQLADIYLSIKPKAEEIDPTLGKSILAEQQKQLNALEQLEKKLIKTAKHKEESEVNQIRRLKDKLFPDGSFQERKMNITEFWLNQGSEIFELIADSMDPLDPKINIITLP